MADSSIWWLLTGAAVAVELMTGTVYLLMVAVGFAAGALTAHMGQSASLQISIATLFAAATTGLWHIYKLRQPPEAHASENSDVNMDIGATIFVSEWQNDRTAKVQYRGSSWSALADIDAELLEGNYKVKAVHGSQLVLENI